jgi:hypothetical protein
MAGEGDDRQARGRETVRVSKGEGRRARVLTGIDYMDNTSSAILYIKFNRAPLFSGNHCNVFPT